MDLKQYGYCFKHRFLSINGQKMHYIDEGRGDPVILLHGNPGWSFYYRNLINALKAEFRVVAPDHIGCGLSDKPGIGEYSYTLQQRVNDLSCFIENIGVKERITFVVHDWGGVIGMSYAVQYPDRIARIIVLNTAAFNITPKKKFPWLLRLARSRLGKYLILHHNAFAIGTAWIGCKVPRMDKSLRKAYCYPYDSPANRIALWKFVDDIPLKPCDISYALLNSTQEKLTQLQHLPMLICWGMKDFVFDKHVLEQWQHYFPKAEVHRFSKHGHYILEDASDKVLPLIKKFMKNISLNENGSTSDSASIVNIAGFLPVLAKRKPDSPAIYFAKRKKDTYQVYTYKQLNQESDWIAAGLLAYGVESGMRVVLMVKPSFEFFSLVFALFKAGIVPVIIDSGLDRAKLRRALEQVEPQGFIGIPLAHVARIILGWGKKTIEKLITVGPRLGWGGASLAQIRKLGQCSAAPALPLTKAQDTAAILFTSGSTGIPKGTVYSHSNFLAQVKYIKKLYAIEPGEVEVPTFVLFALFAPALEMLSVIPYMDFSAPASANPEHIIKLVHSFNASTMFVSPSLLDNLARYATSHNLKMPSLKRVISAGAVVRPKTVALFKQLLNDRAELFTAYGATEALPISNIGGNDILQETQHKTHEGFGICVGKVAPDLAVKIITISDSPITLWSDDLVLTPGEIGEICVQGPQVTAAYFNMAAETTYAKIPLANNQGFYHRMGDVGYLDDQDRLWYCGRKTQRVVSKNKTYFTEVCEGIFNQHPAVFRSALVGVPINGVMQPVVCVELEEDRKHNFLVVKQELLALVVQFPQTENISWILQHKKLPVDIRHNAKITREQVALWASKEINS